MNELGYSLGLVIGLLIVCSITVLPSVLLSKTLFKKMKVMFQTIFSFGIVTILILLYHFSSVGDIHRMRDSFVWWVGLFLLTYLINIRLDKDEWSKFKKKIYK